MPARSLRLMFTNPIPRTSFLDSSLRSQSRENRRLATRQPLGGTHLGHGPRLGADRVTHRPRLHEAAPSFDERDR